jgi:large subunit ribosomal protein L32
MLPVQKKSRARSRWHRSHQAKTPVAYIDCPQCNSPKLPHSACGNCGFVRPGLSLEKKKES